MKITYYKLHDNYIFEHSIDTNGAFYVSHTDDVVVIKQKDDVYGSISWKETHTRHFKILADELVKQLEDQIKYCQKYALPAKLSNTYEEYAGRVNITTGKCYHCNSITNYFKYDGEYLCESCSRDKKTLPNRCEECRIVIEKNQHFCAECKDK